MTLLAAVLLSARRKNICGALHIPPTHVTFNILDFYSLLDLIRKGPHSQLYRQDVEAI